MSALDLLFNPKSVVLVGAAHTEIKFGGVILKNLLRFRGKVFPVNPKYRELMGLQAYPSVQEIPGPVDLAVIIRPAPEVPEILRGLNGKVQCAIIMSSGFAEVGQKVLQDEIKAIGKAIGIRILGPNCMGVFNPRARLDTFFLTQERLRRPRKGNVAILSQSGAILSCLISVLRDSNIGASKVVGYGNAMDIDVSDLNDYLAHDADTDVVVSYIESVGDGRRFIESAKRLSEQKSMIILKAGKGESGQAAAYSHTGRLAGRYEVCHAVLRQFALREAADFDELMDAVKALSYQRPSKGSRVCIITNGGGSGVLAADECMRQGLAVSPLPEDKKERLGQKFPHFFGINNPVDLTAQVMDDEYGITLNVLRDDYDGFLVIALPNVLGITERLGGLMKDFKESSRKPVVLHIAPSGISAKLTARLEKARIPVYPSPERAVRGLRALLDRQ
ncbi:MAG TPA: CoA-binding protein [Nitrospiraceae bacterium]|jgi:acyl-CoA synthetase (NDP forming)|nr:CoA-binding protein [Nitrospiraceae bacterium]